MTRYALLLAAALLPGAAIAQAPMCRPPVAIPTPRADGPSEREPRRLLPIGGYTLAITWSPEKCRGRIGRPDDAFQCGPGAPRFGFTLHGLWPDGEGADWPQYCAPAEILPERIIRPMLCTTPSAQLIQHEWAKHGTCMPGETPESYFARARALYETLRFPDMERLSRRQGLTVAGFRRAFAAASRGLTADVLRVTVRPGGWLDEVWLCRDKGFRPAACPAHQGGAADGQRLRIWRGGPAGGKG